MRVRFTLLFIALALPCVSGCLAVVAGGAAAGAATYYYYKGKVCQDYASSFPDTWQAVQTSLKELGFPVLSQESTATTGQIGSQTSDRTAIAIDFTTAPSRIPAEGNVIRVCVRVGTFGDRELSERILSQVSGHLAPKGLAPRTGSPPPVPAKGPITPASWTKPSETAPPPELPLKPVPGSKP